MKCSECKFWQRSKMYGVKPCEFDRRNKETKARRKRAKRKMEKYDKSDRKVRYDDN